MSFDVWLRGISFEQMEGAGSWPRGIRAPIGGCPISIQVSGAVAEISCWVLAKDYGRGHSRSPEAFFSHNTNSIYIYTYIDRYICIYIYMFFQIHTFNFCIKYKQVENTYNSPEYLEQLSSQAASGDL